MRYRTYLLGAVGATFFALVAGSIGESCSSTGKPPPSQKAIVTIDVNAAGKAVNKALLGTGLGRLSREQWVEPLQFDRPALRQIVSELRPGFVTIDNSDLGFPFYPESTGERAQRMGVLETLRRMNVQKDPVARGALEAAEADPYFNKNQPPPNDYDDLLRFLERLDCIAAVSIRLPIIFTSQTYDEFSDMKLNLDPATAAQLVHYLNDSSSTPLGRLRARNGHPRSYHVKYFVLGNEFWANHFWHGLSIRQIASQVSAFARATRAADPTVKVGINLIDDAYPHRFLKPGAAAEFHRFVEYNDKILRAVAHEIDFVTFHVYSAMENVGRLNTEQWRYVMAQGYFKEKHGAARRHREIVSRYNPELEIAVDEYSGPLGSLGGAIYNAEYLIYLLKNDYVFATNWSMGLMVPADNPWGAIRLDERDDGFRYVRRPNYYALKLFTNYLGDTLVGTSVESPTFDTQALEWSPYFRWPAEQGIPSINAIASTRGDTLYVMLINRDLDRRVIATIRLAGFRPEPRARLYTLGASSIEATNENDAGTVTIQKRVFRGAAALSECPLAPHSIAVLVFTALRD